MLAKNQYWVEHTAANLFTVLDTNQDGALQLDELYDFFPIIVRRSATRVHWGAVAKTTNDFCKAKTVEWFDDKIFPNSSLKEKNGGDMFNLIVTIRNSMVFCSKDVKRSNHEGITAEVNKLGVYFYKVGSIDYNMFD